MAGPISIALALTPLAAASVAGWICVDQLMPERERTERLILGAIVGLALLVLGAYSGAAAGALVLGAIAALAVPIVLRAFARGPTSRLGGSFTALEGGILLLAFAWFALPLLRRAFPIGWDPAFHTAIIELIRQGGRLPETWAPYEPLERFNYPAGLHAAIALIARAGGIKSEAAFNLAFAWLGGLQLLAVHALARRFDPTRLAAPIAVAVFGLTAGWGTLSGHVEWGGLPNLAGLVLMSGFVLLASEPSRVATFLAALVAAAIAVAHHLSFALLAFFAAFIVVFEFALSRRLTPLARCAVTAVGAAVVTAGLFVLLRPTGRFGLGEALHYTAEAMVSPLEAVRLMRWPLLMPGLAGVLAILVTARFTGERLLAAWALALIAFWITWDHLYRALVYALTGESYSAFTPARGLTDAAVPLAVCGGWLLSRIAGRVGRPRTFASAIALLLVVSGGRGELRRLRPDRARIQQFERAVAVCERVRMMTPPESVILAIDAGDAGTWLPYLCRREFDYFPLPVYANSQYRARKIKARDLASFEKVVNERGSRPVFLLTRRRVEGTPILSVEGWSLHRGGERRPEAAPKNPG